jgi:hypothetical protein
MTPPRSDRGTLDDRDLSNAWSGVRMLADSEHEGYSEEAFRCFLTLERKRAERSGRSLLLLLVSLAGDGASGAHMPVGISRKVFSALSSSLRDVDFMGWYHADRVVGAVLAQGTNSPALDVPDQISRRVGDLLNERLPAHVTGRLQIRVLQARQRAQV